MLTVNGAAYKDVTRQDFNHYFSNTAMTWKLSPTKRRLFIVTSVDGDEGIRGSYLTRESLFKEKRLDWVNWWERLDPIVAQPLYFNFPDGCAVWRHHLEKNLRKSFPWKTNCIKYYGLVTNVERTLQHLSRIAFSELYGDPKEYPSLRTALLQNKKAVFTREKFLVDRVTHRVLFHERPIGVLEGKKVALYTNQEHFKPYMFKIGVKEDQFLPLVDNVHPQNEKDWRKMPYKNGYSPGWNPVDALEAECPGFAIVNAAAGALHGKHVTFFGRYSGDMVFDPGWILYNYWNH